MTRHRRARACAFGALAVCLAPSLVGRSQLASALGSSEPVVQQQPVFRGAANLVYVDVYARQNGQIVDDLAAGDFKVAEDGKTQTIELFEFVRVLATAPGAPVRDPNTVSESDRLASDARHRAFVVYLDTPQVTMEGARRMREPLIQFLERVLSPTDFVAILTPDLPESRLTFAQDLTALESDVNRYWEHVIDDSPEDAPVPRNPQESRLSACYISRTTSDQANKAFVRDLIHRRRQEATIESLKALVARVASLRAERTNVLLFSGGWKPYGPINMSYLWNTVPLVGVSPTGRMTTETPGTGDKTACDAEAQRLSSIDLPEEIRDLVEVAKRANVAFITIDPGGLGAFDCDVRLTGPCSTTQQLAAPGGVLRNLAVNTNGVAIVATNDLMTPMQQMAEGLSAYYLLGYYSTNTKQDGKYRKLQVTLRRPGVSISARAGYIAPSPPHK